MTTHSVRATDDSWIEHFDPQSPDLPADLHETLAELRAKCPVVHSDQHDGFWVVTKYDDVRDVAENWETFSSEHGVLVPPAPTAVRNLPVEADPPLQREYKRLINRYVTPAACEPWAEPTRRLVNDLIDGFIDRGRCEFIDEFARPFPSLSFFELTINAPVEDLPKLAELTSKSSIPTHPEAAASWLALSEWITDFTEQRRRQPPKGDVMDGILEATIDGRPLSQEEIIGLVQNIVVGGLKTTTTALGMMMIRLCQEPEIPELLRRQPEVIPSAVEELLRVDAPVTATARTAMGEGMLGAHPVEQGDRVVVYWASANRDEDEFPNPDVVDLHRSPNRHLAFGLGVHRCAGSNLARMNLRIALHELVQRLDDLRIEDGAEILYTPGAVRSPLAVPIRFTPSTRTGSADS